jgi:hypothetical protein
LGLVPREHSTGGKQKLLGIEQAREPICPQAPRSWRALLLPTPGSNAGSPWKLA